MEKSVLHLCFFPNPVVNTEISFFKYFEHLINIFIYACIKHTTIWIIQVLKTKSHNVPTANYHAPWNGSLLFFDHLKTISPLIFLLGSGLPPLSVHVPWWSWFHPLLQGYVSDPGLSHTVHFILPSTEIDSEMDTLLDLEHWPQGMDFFFSNW